MKIFSVYDSSAEAYLQPFFARAPGEAVRQFQTAVNTADHNFHAYAADFTLFMIGVWDEKSGTIDPYPQQENLGNGLHFLEIEKEHDNG